MYNEGVSKIYNKDSNNKKKYQKYIVNTERIQIFAKKFSDCLTAVKEFLKFMSWEESEKRERKTR